MGSIGLRAQGCGQYCLEFRAQGVEFRIWGGLSGSWFCVRFGILRSRTLHMSCSLNSSRGVI